METTNKPQPLIDVLDKTEGVEWVDITPEFKAGIDAQYEKMNTKNTFTNVEQQENQEPKSDNPEVNDEMEKALEILYANPDFLAKDLRDVFKKHDLSLAEFLSDFGFNKDNLEGFMRAKTVAEQIYILSREFRQYLFRLGVQSEKKYIQEQKEQNPDAEESTLVPPAYKFSTLNIRLLLNDNSDGKEFLDILDTQVLPYIKHYKEHQTIDTEWFTRDLNKDARLPEELVGDELVGMVESQGDYLREMEKIEKVGEMLFDKDGNPLPEIIEFDEDGNPIFPTETQDSIQVSHGEETVLETNETTLEEVSKQTPQEASLTVGENDNLPNPPEVIDVNDAHLCE